MHLHNQAHADTSAQREWSALCTRVLAEFREMPGLQITLAQAARLFGLDLDRCEGVLRDLVLGGELRTNGRLFALLDVLAERRAVGSPKPASHAVVIEATQDAIARDRSAS